MNKVFALITAFIVALGCFMGIFALNSCEVAHAFSSDIPNEYFLLRRVINNSLSNENSTLMFELDTTNNSNGYDGPFFFIWYDNSTQLYVLNSDHTGYINPANFPLVRGQWVNLHMSKTGANFAVDYYNVFYYCSNSFDFSNIREIHYLSGSDSNGHYLELGYYDGTGNYLRFQFPVYYDSSYDYYMWSSSVVYVTPVDQSSADYQAGYNYGYDNGYNTGYDLGETTGYNNGYNRGYNAGNAVGYEDGVNSANTYTFFGLFSAVLDAPLQVFRGLLDFDVLGINLSGFALSLFSVAMVIAIIRFIMAK